MTWNLPVWLSLPWVHGLLICALTAAAYAGVVQAGFVVDDHPLVLYNQATASLSQLGRLFSEDLWASADGGYASGYYRPLVLLSFAVDRSLFGGAPGMFHLHSLAWHLLACLCLHRLLLQLLRPLPALVGAALFALHPLQSEAVVWISARNDLMAAALLLASLVLLAPTHVRRWRLAAGALLACGAVLSKESALLAPLFLLCLDLARQGRPSGWPRYLCLLGAAGLHLCLRSLAGVNSAALPPASGWRVLLEHAHQLMALYGGLLVWPWPLSLGRDLGSLQLAWPVLVAGLVALGALICLLLLPRQGRRLASAGLAWSLLAWSPALLALADQGLVGERYLYLPLAGLGLAVAVAAQRLRGRAALLLLLALPWLVLVHLRVPDWKDDIAIWSAALRDTPSSYVEASLGHVFSLDGRDQEAGEHFTRAVLGEPPRLEVCHALATAAGRRSDPRASLRQTDPVASRCAASGSFRGQRATWLAMLGRWEDALAVAEQGGDPQRRDELVLAAWGVVSGDCARYRSLLMDTADPASATAQLQHLLRLGGHAQLALGLGQGGSCSAPVPAGGAGP